MAARPPNRENQPLTAKPALREKFQSARDGLADKQRAEHSAQILRSLIGGDFFSGAQKILSYLSFRSEVDTWPLARTILELPDKRLFLPRIGKNSNGMTAVEVLNLERDLEPGPFGLMQPRERPGAEVSPAELDLVVVPGLAWTPQGRRLGYGGGYFDRFLAERPRAMITCGLAFEMQICVELPQDEWDVAVDWLITESRTIAVRQG